MITCCTPGTEEQPEAGARAPESSEIAQINKAIEENPDDPDAYYQRALYHHRNGNDADAIFDMVAAMKMDSINESYHHLLVDAYLGALKSEYALITMERSLRLFPESMPNLIKGAELQIILRQYDQAARTLRQAMEIDPRNTDALYLLGVLFQEQGDIDQAAQSFQTVVELDAENKEAWTMLGNLYDIQGNELALQCFENAISIDPTYSPAWHSKAFYLQNHNRIDEAIEIYLKIHEMDPQYAEAYLNAGILYLEKGELDLAEREFELLRELQPNFALGAYYLGVVEERRGNLQEALGFFNQATALSPSNPRFAEAVERVSVELGVR